MNDEQRLQALEQYNPGEHLVQIRAKDGTLKDYYPATWRLYELRLKFPHITIESEIILLDVEHNLVIVKAWIFDGKPTLSQNAAPVVPNRARSHLSIR